MRSTFTLTLAMVALLGSACGQDASSPDPVFAGAETDADVEAATASSDQGKADGATSGQTLLLQLDSHPVPVAGRPSALVYLPVGFDKTPPLNVVVFLHGWYNCVENVVRATGKPCQPGGPSRSGFGLAAQLEAARKNAILLVPELAFDQASSEAGQLGEPDGLLAVLDETLQKLEPVLGPVGPGDLGQLIVASHSGGYKAAAGMATQGGVPISELYLLDSLYGLTDEYDAWLKGDLQSFGASPPVRRFASVYSLTGGTLADSQAMAGRARGWLAESQLDPAALVDDRTTSTWGTETFAHGLLFKRTSLSHDNVARFYFGRLLATSALPDVPSP